MGRNNREALFQQYAQRGDVLGQYYPWTNAPASAWTPYDVRDVATVASGAATTLSVSIGTDGSGGPPATTMDVTAAAGGSDNHREFFMRSDKNYEFSQITSIIYGGGTWVDSNNRSQQGHVHRYQKLPNGRIRAFVAWHDVVIEDPSVLNVGIWEIDGAGTGTLNLHTVNNFLPLSAPPSIPVQICSRASNVLTIWTAGRHWIRPGEFINLTVRDAANLTELPVTTVAFDNFIQATHAGAPAADMGPGLLLKSPPPGNPLSDFPYVLSSRLLPGDIFQAKIWRPWEAEPTWDGALTYATPNPIHPLTGAKPGPPLDERWPRGRGLSGVFVGHIWDSRVVRFGLPEIREIVG